MEILPKKLNELESHILKTAGGTPPEIASTCDSRRLSSEDFEQRCNFLENLLKAEEASSSRKNSSELRDRIAALKTTFLLNNGKFSASNADDSQSVCSDCCTQASLKDAAVESGTLVSDLDNFTEKQAIIGIGDEEEEEEKEKKRTGVVMKNYLAVFTCGLIVGAGLVLKFVDSREFFFFFPFLSDQQVLLSRPT
ncbi:hypothetical protein M569_07281 [Genlisea aurea]|uniref:DUF7610 domain-containing protein n=1 Tax=Genlisea aurea TaxID=192259 RepID=S8CL80_9LAMI|nr:hypothetical protein M569_07281 [Genlisea aurea]